MRIKRMTKEKELSPEGKARIMASQNPDYITPKQQAFIHAYIANGGNGSQAAITAGYAPKGSRVTACELLKMEKIQKRLVPTLTEQKERLSLDADWIVSKLMDEAKDDDSPAAARIRALELLGKVEGLFAPEKKQIETINGGDFLTACKQTEHTTFDGDALGADTCTTTREGLGCVGQLVVASECGDVGCVKERYVTHGALLSE